MRRAPIVLGIMMVCLEGLWSGPWEASAGVQIDVHVGVPAPPIVVEVPPQLVLVPGVPVYYAPDVPYNYFYHAGTYYVFHDGRWFHAHAHNGPWIVIDVRKVPAPILRVPVAYYSVPPGHWKQHGPPPWHSHGHRHSHGKHPHKHHHGKHDHDKD